MLPRLDVTILIGIVLVSNGLSATMGCTLSAYCQQCAPRVTTKRGSPLQKEATKGAFFAWGAKVAYGIIGRRENDQRRRYRMGSHVHGPGDVDDARTRLLLRRHGEAQEHPRHSDAVLYVLCILTLQWVLFGYSLSFSPGSKFIGSLSWFGLHGVGSAPYAAYAPGIPHEAFMIFQAMFCHYYRP